MSMIAQSGMDALYSYEYNDCPTSPQIPSAHMKPLLPMKKEDATLTRRGAPSEHFQS
jgi:hypothetical protein